jgi:hypothetical protein
LRRARRLRRDRRFRRARRLRRDRSLRRDRRLRRNRRFRRDRRLRRLRRFSRANLLALLNLLEIIPSLYNMVYITCGSRVNCMSYIQNNGYDMLVVISEILDVTVFLYLPLGLQSCPTGFI